MREVSASRCDGEQAERLSILDLDANFLTSELVDEWTRQFRLAILNRTGYARAIVQASDRQ